MTTEFINHTCIDCRTYAAQPTIPFCSECEHERAECADLITRMIERYESEFHVEFNRTDLSDDEWQTVSDDELIFGAP